MASLWRDLISLAIDGGALPGREMQLTHYPVQRERFQTRAMDKETERCRTMNQIKCSDRDLAADQPLRGNCASFLTF